MAMSMKERLIRFRSFWIFPVLGILMLYLAFRQEPAGRLHNLFWLVPAGIFIWTLLEYGLHRFAFHIQVPIRNQLLRDIVNGSHMLHHASPRDPDKVLVHPSFGIAVSVILYGLLWMILHDGFSTMGILVGIWMGFLYYEAVHYRVHFNLSGSGLIARQRRTHFYHHFINNKRCFGVTSPLWDYVFGTTMK
jgi:sterol desaturase/sphingolipid hydroxylase (fatty acid hydroxylase superfamily)